LSENDDADLVVRLKAGDEAAFSELVHTYGPRLLKHAEQFLKDNTAAQDSVQDVFLQAFQKIHNFREEAALVTWLHRILINNCLAYLRKNESAETLTIDSLMPKFDWTGTRTEARHEPLPSVKDLIAQKKICETALKKMNQLPDLYRCVLLLRDIEGYSTHEASAALLISVSMVKVRLHRARSALKKLLEPTLLEFHT